MACETCRLKKIKCDKVRPKCRRCEVRKLSCHYAGERRQSKKLDASEIERRLHQIENVFRHMNEGVPEENAEANRNEVPAGRESSQTAPVAYATGAVYLQENDHVAGDNDMDFLWSIDTSPATSADPPNRYTPNPNPTETRLPISIVSRDDKLPRSKNLLDQILSSEPGPQPVENNAAVWIRTQDGDEYTGPSSGISLLSNPGLSWIENTFAGTEDVCNTLKGVTIDVASHLQMPKCIPSTQWALMDIKRPLKPLPTEAIAWTYVAAYFKSVQCIFPALDRQSFESRLHAYFRGPKDSDIAWAALLNAVLAAGCRALLSAETPSAFELSGTESWGYFQNAIDMVSQLLYKPAKSAGVEALIVMTVFAQGLSSPQRLEYTFSALATQVAQGLGLHRQPLQSWHLSDSVIRERNRLFWVVYALDKTISLRCGRPSLIDDDEISCSFPYGTHILQDVTLNSIGTGGQTVEQSQLRLDFFLVYTQYARICGEIAKQLYSASALSRPFSELLTTAARLENAIDKWRDSIPYDFRPGRLFKPSEIPNDFPQIQALSLNFGYHYVICSVHRRFSAMFGNSDHESLPLSNLRLADTKFLEAARSMILLTKHLDIESHTPGWLLFYYPVTALIGVFTYVVCNPKAASGRSNTALMEVIVGHLGRLEFMTSGGTAFNRIGELVRLARIILDRASNDQPTGISSGMGRDQSLPATSSVSHDKIRRQSTIEGLRDRGMNEESTDNHARTSNSPQQSGHRNIIGSETQTSFDHGHVALSLPGLPSTDNPDEREHQLQIPTLDYSNTNINLVTGHPNTSFIPRNVENDKEGLTEEDLFHLQIQQRAVDNYSGWGTGIMNSADYHQYLPGEFADG